MFTKILVANRGEIAVRAFRAAAELGVRSVAVFPHEDRHAEYRLKADESYQIGEEGHPVRSYLDIAGIIDAARRAGADAIYPGYGFLSENPDLAAACREAGIVLVGPPEEVLHLTGNKARAIAAAQEAGLPTLTTSESSEDVDVLLRAAESVGFPLFVKAVSGGGGRGMRRVDSAADLAAALTEASREAVSAFGDARMYLEQAVVRPRHIEVQVLADAEGNVVHLFERDCSVQRRHQKVVEIAPAPNLDPALRQTLCEDAVRFARHIGYVNAGTVEFLVGEDGRHVFIEMNPRIQVEHTVTEAVTTIDLVATQMRIAAGETLPQIGLSQERVEVRGTALQCRITTEDPANGFRPDSGIVSVYRTPGGTGVRLDGGVVFSGATISAHFDSMLVKLTCHGTDLRNAARRAHRALMEFRIRGVATNIPFLEAVISDPDFLAGTTSTSFIDERPHLVSGRLPADRGTKLLRHLAEVTVNQPHGPATAQVTIEEKVPRLSDELASQESRHGSRQRLLALGPARWAEELRAQTAVGVTDTTLRDAHQSLLATRVRTRDLLTVAPVIARLLPGLLSVEAWGGATYDVALRFLKEDPWERLDALHRAMPNLPIQMLLRGRNTVGYTPYPLTVTRAFVAEAARSGVDLFRIFDALNNVDQIRPAVDAVLETDHAVAEVALCYTGNMTSPKEKLYTLDYYLRLAEQLVATGAHVLAIKDMAGLLRAPAAAKLVAALRSNFDLPVHLHTHDTPGGQLATLLSAIEAGVDAVDVAAAPLAGTTSQVSMSALVAALEDTPRAPQLDLAAVDSLEPSFEALRSQYAPFESGLPGPTGSVYRHEIPGGQLSNLRQQANALGLGNRFEAVTGMYAHANRILGNIVKVTPSSKVVGDLALALVGRDANPDHFEQHPQDYDIPDSVLGFLAGDLGVPPGGWPEPFREKALAGRAPQPALPTLTEEQTADLERDPRRTLHQLLFPAQLRDYEEAVAAYGDLSVLPTREFLHGLVQGDEIEVELERGRSLLLAIRAIGEPDEAGMRQVMCTVNGQLRVVVVRDESVGASVTKVERANPDDPRQIGAPFAGVVTLVVAPGDDVAAGEPVATIEAMKMEAAITSPVSAVVHRVAIGATQAVEGGDLLVELR